jgi:hypothetical protein
MCSTYFPLPVMSLFACPQEEYACSQAYKEISLELGTERVFDFNRNFQTNDTCHYVVTASDFNSSLVVNQSRFLQIYVE